MPDSLWQGYSWWRLSFTADSSLYQQMTQLHLGTWSAAEVYLDGQLTYDVSNGTTVSLVFKKTKLG